MGSRPARRGGLRPLRATEHSTGCAATLLAQPSCRRLQCPHSATRVIAQSPTVPSPVVALNRAVAVAMAEGPAAGLLLVEELEQSGALAEYHLLPATRADLLRRLGRKEQADVAYRRALDLAPTDAERRFLIKRLGEVSAAP
jgi:RNA polymerase sigma-70 factor (ECF subfamily)